MKNLIYIILSLLIIGIFLFVIVLNLPKATTKNKAATIELDAIELLDDFIASEINANKKYIGKIIEVQGIISRIEKDKKGSSVIMLKTNDKIKSILCTMENEPKGLAAGQQVKIKGICNGYLLDVVLNRCNLVKS